MVIDSHQHFWKLTPETPVKVGEGPAASVFDYRWLDGPKLAPIRKDRMPADLAPLMRTAGVDRSIIVQTQHSLRENQWAVDELAGSYTQVKSALEEALGPISKAEHDKIFGGTATRFYGLK